MQVTPKRFEKFGLTIHPEKTKMIPFGKPASKKEVSKGDAEEHSRHAGMVSEQSA